ncbi:hypothetical protein [Aeromonas bestiarum]|uniref:Type VI secretion system spike protein VgrG3-like C-terminal domain-containing protein n=1 Tax=Aeromonas bestiarum TaxID=105751 RepID=A0ABT7Q1U1_9GAMM|nr:hypothetical protein [Aeromonas bestiarum]MDM5073059.1 hypothetical protein [Aeromonas bestiarum]
MKIVYPMQLEGENGPSEVPSLDAFIEKINSLKSGTFLIGRNRIWHGGIHLSEKGGWHPSGAVRAITDGEIVAYRLATEPAKATRSPEAGKPGEGIDLYTSPSFCLVRHHYEAGEQNKNRLTFYCLYMHIACENTYNSPEAARVTVKGTGVSTYEPVAGGDPLKLTRRLSGNNPVHAKTGAEVKLLQQTPSNLRNHRDEVHNYFLVHYVDEPNSPFYIAQSQLQQEYPQKPKWMTPPEGKPARHNIPGNTWLRQTADTTAGSLGLPAGSEVVVSGESQMVTVGGGPTEFRKVQVFKAGSGSVKDSANRVMTNAGKGSLGWLAKSKMGAGLAAEPSVPVEFKEDAPVVDRSDNPIAVQAGEVIGHWGEHQIATAGASGFVKDADSKTVHFEVFVADSDKQALEDCINNKARVSGGQGYLLLNQEVTTYRLTSDSQHGFHDVAKFGPLVLPLAVKESAKVSHGANNFVKVRERTAADGELAGEFVLLADGVEVVSQHDWHKLGVKLVDGSSDEDGFLDKADTATDSEESLQKEASEFFSTIYDKLVTDRDNDGTLSGNDIKAALADEELAGKLRMLFIKHKSEWVQPGDWPRLKQELADQPELYKYAMQVHNNMAWMEDASAILGDTKPWFIHPAGMMGLVKSYQKEALWVLGKTSERYESGGRGPGVVSTGKGDYGGASYGCYQLSSNLGVVQLYIQSSKYKDFFEGLLPATPQFNSAWKNVAANDPEGFREEQHRFIKETHYDIQIERLKSKGLLIEHNRAAVHDLVWSTAVQFGAKTNLIINALSNFDLQRISDKELIVTVQNYKKNNTETLFKSSPTLWKDLKDRADSEKKALLELENKMFEVEIK